ncbi:MAG: nucleoside hydrolase [Chitinophagaceae bacterium]|nr:nucleoside hydrolase [Chitinophagaceae bacterium]
MKIKILSFLLMFIFLHQLHAQKKQPVPVIFDTDMGPDYDDVGAMALLHYFEDRGDARILATMASSKHSNVAATLSVLNTYFQRPEIPVGIPKALADTMSDFQHWTDSLISKYPHNIKNNDEAEDAVKLYRKILATQKDKSVTIITVGFFTNLFQLLQSQPDKYSKLTGEALVQQKVQQLVSMAGIFPAGIEFNIIKHKEAAKYVFEHWPTSIIISGFEIGKNIKTGIPLIKNKHIQNSPVKDAFRIAIPLSVQDSAGRMSWDETAVLVAIAGYAPWYDLARGKISVDVADGSNLWTEDKTGTHYHLIEKAPPAVIEKMINDMMMHVPGK